MEEFGQLIPSMLLAVLLFTLLSKDMLTVVLFEVLLDWESFMLLT